MDPVQEQREWMARFLRSDAEAAELWAYLDRTGALAVRDERKLTPAEVDPMNRLFKRVGAYIRAHGPN